MSAPLADVGGQEIYSPYAAMGNNPGMMVDPMGTIFTDVAENMVTQFINDVNTKHAENSRRILELQGMLGGTPQEIFGINQEIAKLVNNNMDLKAILTEVGELRGSSQVYDIRHENESVDTRDPNAQEKGSEARFNFATGVFEIVVRDKYAGTLAHELTHAYQFEMGKIDFRLNGKRILGDKYDEVAAWNRTTLFAKTTYRNAFTPEKISSLSTVYRDMELGPYDYTNRGSYLILYNTPDFQNRLQKFADKTKSAFRIAGITYYYHSND